MPRRQPNLINRGDVWDAEIPGVGVHPVVVVTRDVAIPVLSAVVCALVTSSFHEHVAEVEVGPEQGLDHESGVNADNLFTLPKAVLTRRRGHLGEPLLSELDLALTIALGLR